MIDIEKRVESLEKSVVLLQFIIHRMQSEQIADIRQDNSGMVRCKCCGLVPSPHMCSCGL